MKQIVMILAILLLSIPASAETIIFQENFESYADDSNLSGQGGWTGSATMVGTGSGIISKVSDGRNAPTNDIAFTDQYIAGGFSPDYVYTLTFDAYATTSSPASHNSSVNIFSAENTLRNGGGWWMMNGSWVFDARYLTGSGASVFWFSGGYDQTVFLTTIVDPLNLKMYGILEFGGVTTETQHLPILIERFNTLDGITIVQDYRGGSGGAEFDNIKLTSSAEFTPVPEPATILLLGTGLVGFAGFRKRLKRS